MLGATPLTTSLRIRMTLPLIWPTLASTFLLIFIFVSENFAVPTMLGTPINYHTLMYDVYRLMSIEPTSPPLAATAGTVLLSIAIVGTVWQRRIIARAGHYATISGKGGSQRVTDLGRWKPVATGFLVFYLLLAVVIPYLALVFGSLMNFVTPRIRPQNFTLDNYARLLDGDYLQAMKNSVIFAGGGALVATLLYVLLAYLIKRSEGATGMIAEYVVMIPTVTPAMVLGVGFIWTFVASPVPIYGTVWLLLLGYFVRYVGQGVRQSRAALVQISEELPEAARISGATPFRVFRDVVIPLLRPATVPLWTVMFIMFFMEISITIMLYSPRTITLPVLL
jgi:iron(III) transport system permease protein